MQGFLPTELMVQIAEKTAITLPLK